MAAVGLQHVLGVITALLIFAFYKRINGCLAFVISMMVFSNAAAVGLEHYVLRDSIVAFLQTLLIFLMFTTGKSRLPGMQGAIAGVISIVIVLIRIEMIVLVLLLPLLWFLLNRYHNPSSGDNAFGKRFVRYAGGYGLPFAIVLALIGFMRYTQNDEYHFSQYSGCYFNVAYHGLDPAVFYYQGSRYPELLESYQKTLEDQKTVTKSMGLFYEATQKYLAKHSEIEMNFLQLMDNIFVEMVIKNFSAYLKSYYVNLKNQALGNNGLGISVKPKPYPTGNKYIDRLFWVATYPAFYPSKAMVNKILFTLFVITFPFILFNFRRLPNQIVVAVFVTLVVLTVLSGVASATYRFRYPIEAFMFSVPLYALYVFVRTAVLKITKIFQRPIKEIIT